MSYGLENNLDAQKTSDATKSEIANCGANLIQEGSSMGLFGKGRTDNPSELGLPTTQLFDQSSETPDQPC